MDVLSTPAGNESSISSNFRVVTSRRCRAQCALRVDMWKFQLLTGAQAHVRATQAIRYVRRAPVSQQRSVELVSCIVLCAGSQPSELIVSDLLLAHSWRLLLLFRCADHLMGA